MKKITIKKVEEMDVYSGEYVKPGISFIYAGKSLGIQSWGMNIIRMEAGAIDYPDHDHIADGQEEVYVILEGSATLIVGEEKTELEKGVFVHVPPEIKRQFIPGENGVTILALGGTPGQAYKTN